MNGNWPAVLVLGIYLADHPNTAGYLIRRQWWSPPTCAERAPLRQSAQHHEGEEDAIRREEARRPGSRCDATGDVVLEEPEPVRSLVGYR